MRLGNVRAFTRAVLAPTISSLVALVLLLVPVLRGHGAVNNRLPNGWQVTPAGSTTPLGTLPLHMVEDSSGRFVLVTLGGYGQLSIAAVSEASGTIVSSVPIKDAFYGLSATGHDVYASSAFGIEHLTISGDGVLTDAGPFGPQSADFGISGVTASDSQVFVADGAHNAVIAYDRKGQQLWSTRVDAWPYGVDLTPDGRTLYVSNWVAGRVSVLDAKSGALKGTLAVASHPNAVLVSSDGATVFVACANDDVVEAIDTKTNAIRAKIQADIFSQALPGAMPNGLSLSADGQTLFVADAGINAVVAIDVHASPPAVYGAVPTGWWPTDVLASHDGQKLYVLDGKGVAGHANPSFIHSDIVARPSPDDYKYYVANTAGDIESLQMPDRSKLAAGLSAVRWDSSYSPRSVTGRIAPEGVHVIYVIKENRTYDEVLGDDPRGNGDARLAIFGKRITPNIHALADDFALLDNFDTDAEVSADGHNWSTAAYSSDYVDKLWPATYAGRRTAGGHRVYDYEEAGPASPPGGYLWDDARRSGVTVRDYGEFVTQGRHGLSVPSTPSLAGLIDPRYPGFNLNISDQDRINEWLAEFRNYVAHNNLPQLEIVRLPNDHTAATRPRSKTPYAMVADNDYAFGRLVEAVSHSRYWRDTIIFSVEDDAQAGPDHVSDHRAEVLVIGARVRRGFVDHTHYTTSSVLRTIEEILGMPPMSEFDAGATTMFKLQADEPNTAPWVARRPLVNLDDTNGANPDAKTSQRLDLDQADAADAGVLAAILHRYAQRASASVQR